MNANDKSGLKDPNSIIYDVKSFKSYFFMGDYIITIGAGISNLNTSLDGEILLNAKIRASKWKELNPNNKKKENISQEIPIFQLSINNGKNIQNGEYAYIVYLENEFTTNKM